MRAAFLTFFGIALLGLHQPALAKKGGWSSNGSGSSGGGSRSSSRSHCSDTATDLGGDASNPFDPMYSGQWLYKFVGSYYNGSVEVEATIDMDDVSCEDQKPVFKQKLDAVLVIGEQLSGLAESSSSPYMFSVAGWKEGTQPRGMPSAKTNWLSPDTRLIYESVSNARSSRTKHAAWAVTNQKSGNGYSFDAIVTDSFLKWDQSRTIFSVSPCNGSEPVDFHMLAYDKFNSTYKKTEAYVPQRARANGTFDDTSATLSIAGGFKGTFMNWYSYYDSHAPTIRTKYGTYKLKFSGKIDRTHSHALSTSGQTPSWTKDQDLLPGGPKAASGASTTCRGTTSTGSRAEVGKAVLGLAGLGGLVAVGVEMILW